MAIIWNTTLRTYIKQQQTKYNKLLPSTLILKVQKLFNTNGRYSIRNSTT